MRLSRYWHTLRHLRPVQFYGRLWFRLVRPRPDDRPAPPLRHARGRPTFVAASSRPDGWLAFPRLRAASMLGMARFRFLNQMHDVPAPEAWNDPARDKLWLYNLHYFDDLNAVGAAERAEWHRALVARWIDENPPGQGNGWEPYPTSLRLVNWIKWALREDASSPECRDSLAVQARWLRRRIEHHLLGNHLFANAKALVFAGAFFVGPEADRWLARGQRLLTRELREQILADGGHFERSPMYHAILLEDVLDLLQLERLYPGILDASLLNLCEEKAEAMLRWLAAMTHPDGQISFFNDAAFGIAATLAELASYAAALGIGAEGTEAKRGTEALRQDGTEQRGSEECSVPHLTSASVPSPRAPVVLRDSGYIRLEAGPALALLDVAPIGPDYLPGHAHADTLSFELSLFGQRTIVNGGTSRYGSGPERLAERSTEAHSTVQIDGADSSEVWGGFRVARRARPFDVQVASGDPCRVAAAHDGYRRLPGRVVHRRSWELSATQLTVIDRIEGAYREAVARFHLHPDIAADWSGDAGSLRLPGGGVVQMRASGGVARLVADVWHPEFGIERPALCLEFMVMGERSACQLQLSWAKAGNR